MSRPALEPFEPTPGRPPVTEGSVHPIRVPVLAWVFLRAFTIQGSWNYRTMVGCGFAFVLLPLLRHVYGRSGPDLDAALSRHVELFNAHPYLANVALGAVARLEADGERPDVVARFKAAVRGPLGGLGDTLVWTGWLPVSLLLALAAAWAGAAPLLCVLLFLVVYNIGHLAVRSWAFVVGFQEGVAVGSRLRGAELSRRTESLLRGGAMLLGALCGLMLTSERGLGGTGPVWIGSAALAFTIGLRGGLRTWRPAALAVVGVVGLLFVFFSAA